MNKKAFTLIELLVVIAIICLMAGIGLLNYRNLIVKGKVKAASTELMAIAMALKEIYADNNSYSFLSELFSVSNPDSDKYINWNGPYMVFNNTGDNDIPDDPWGNDYELNTSSVPARIRSLGIDGKPDGWEDVNKYNPGTNGVMSKGDIIFKF